MLIYAIFNDITRRTRDNLIFPSIQAGLVSYGSHFNLRNVVRSRLTILVHILVDNDTGGETNRVVEIHLAVNHHEAQRLIDATGILRVSRRVVPAQAGVHSTDNVLAPNILDVGSMLGNSGDCIIAGIHVGVTTDNSCIRIRDVSFHQMNYLTSVSSFIIKNDFGFFDTRSYVPVFFANDIIIIITRFCLVMSIIICRKHGQRHSAKQRNQAKHQRQNFFESFVHSQTPFHFFFDTFALFNREIEERLY